MEKQLKAAQRRRRHALAAGCDPGSINAEIRALRQRLQEGPVLRPGARLAGRYELLERIGRGAFASVWKALDRRQDDAVVAVKVLHHDLLDGAAQRRFFNGAKRMAALSHPGIVKVLRRKGADGYWQFFVMEYISGGDVQRAVTTGRLLPERVPALITAVARALAHAHEQGLVHRDVSPHNILLDEQGRPHLTDFDLVRAADSLRASRTNVGMGKYLYAAPEALASGKHCDARADVYSLAAVAVFALHGSIDDDLLREGVEGLACPAALKALLKRALSRKREGRPVDGAAFAAEWEQALSAPATPAPEEAPPVTRVQAPTRVVPSPAPALRFFTFETVILDNRGQITKRERHAARSFVEDLGGGVGLELVAILAGRFLMGSPPNEVDRSLDEGPQNEVQVPAFLMGRFTVTQAQWRAVAGWPKVQMALEPDPAYFKGDERPVERVSWHDAVEFCARLTARTGRAYRLPSEAEWEYAARAGTTTPFALGETLTPEIANYDGNYPYARAPKGQRRNETVAVGSLGVPNAFGLFDLHGNVYEWCQDQWHDTYTGAPTDGRAWDEDGDAGSRVLRGGSWYDYARHCRSANRDGNAADGRHLNLGVRVVCEVARA